MSNHQEASEQVKRSGWTQVPPTEQDWYWHWNGDEDSAPFPLSVLYSGTTGKCFVHRGQAGLEHAIDCDEYGGWWKPMPTPQTPTQIELQAIRLAPPVAAPTDRALACAKHLLMHTMGELRGMSCYANPTDALNGRAAVVAEVIQRICLPAPATATEGEVGELPLVQCLEQVLGHMAMTYGEDAECLHVLSIELEDERARHTATQQKELK